MTTAATVKHYRPDNHQLHVHRLEGGREYEVEHLDPLGTLVSAGTVDSDTIDAVVASWITEADHACDAYARPCATNGSIGHGWECGKCGFFLQAG